MKIIQCPSTTSSCSGKDTSLHILLSLFTISDKNQLVHWQVGYPEIQGDEYPNKDSYEEGQRANERQHLGIHPSNTP